MSRFISILLAFFLASQVLAQDGVTVVDDSIGSRSVGTTMRFSVLLPPGYDHSHEYYTTIYLLHGFGGDHTDWVTRTGIVNYAREYKFIIITLDGHNGWYTNAFDNKRNYEDYILRELIPSVEKKYRALNTRHGRIIAGLSMGGYGAVKLALKHPWQFVFAGSFSGAMYAPAGSRPDNNNISESLRAAFGPERSDHWTKNDPFAYIDSAKVVSTLPYLYIATGKDDAHGRIIDQNRKLVERFRERGMLYEYHETPGGHTWQYWDKEIRNFLRRVSMFDPLNP